MDIRSWLRSLELEQYADAFEANDLTFEDLEELTQDELKGDLGVSSLGHRKKILKAIESLSGLGEAEQAIIDAYPYLIAYPFKLMLEEKNSFQKLQLMKDVFLNLLKYLGLLTATEYFFSALKSDEINNLFKEKLYQPHFGHWNHFIRESLAILEGRDHQFLIPELPDYYKRVQLNKKAPKYALETRFTDEMGEIQVKKKSLTAIDGLINFRNRYIGHGVTLSPEQSREVFDTHYPLLLDLLSAMDFCTSYPLFRYKDGVIYRLMGISAAAADQEAVPDKKTGNIWLGTPQGSSPGSSPGTRLPLVPFFIPPEQYMAGLSADIQLFIYEQHTSRRILYFSPEQTAGEAAGEPVAMLDELLAEKDRRPAVAAAEIDRDEVAQTAEACSRRALKELEQERKVLPGIYQSRGDNEAEIQSFLDSAAALYFLAAEAGSGKTNLMAETCRKAGEAGRPVLLLRAGRQEESDIGVVLNRLFNLAEGDDFSQIDGLKQAPSSLLILIDGGNEHRRPADFFQSLSGLLTRCPTGSIKIIVSWRVNSPEDFPPAFPGIDHYLYGGGSGSSEGSFLQNSAGRLKPLDREELAGAWKAYGASRLKIYKPAFSLEELEMKDRAFAGSLANPLLLRMFLELYHGKALGKKVKIVRIWPAWYESLKSRIPGVDEFLMTLVEQMYQQGDTVLDLDGLYDHPLLAEVMRQLHIDSPYRRLLNLGVLSQYFRDGYLVLTFTIEAAYHYLLSRYLAERAGAGSGRDLLRILREKAGLSGVKEAVSLLLLEDVLRRDGTLLKDFLALEGIPAETAALPLARALELGEPEAIIGELLERRFDNTVEALLAADYILEKNLLTEIRYRALAVPAAGLQDSAALCDPDLRFRLLRRYNIVAHEHGRYQEALDYALLLDRIRQERDGQDDLLKARVYNRLSIAYRKLMRSVDPETAADYGEKAREYTEAALGIMEATLPPAHPELCAVYDTAEKVHEYREEWKEAIAYGLKLIKARESVLDPLHPSLAPAYNNTAIVLREDGQEDRSIEFSRKAMEIVSRSLDPNHIEMAYANWTLANTYDKFGRPAEAVEAISRTIKILEKLLPPEHPNITLAYKTREGFSQKLEP